jgi:hypothetical protein
LEPGISDEALEREFRTDLPGLGRGRRQSKEWAVLTENNMIAILKEQPYGHNHHYCTIAMSPSPWQGETVTKIVVLRYDYPLEIDDDGDDVFDPAKMNSGATLAALSETHKILHFDKADFELRPLYRVL